MYFRLFLAFCLALLPVSAATSSDHESEAGQEGALITVTVLGSGTPVPSATQAGASILVEAGGEYFMFDCGRACTTRLAQVDPRLVSRVHNLFLTHMHSDHIVGIPDLWLNGWTQNRTRSLTTWGPIGTVDFFGALRLAFRRDIEFRLADGVPASDAGLVSDFHDLPPEGGVVYEENGVTVTAFLVDHAAIKPAYGYKLEYAGKSVVISGDTTVAENLYTYGAGADVLMLEVISPGIVKYLEANFEPKQVQTVLDLHLTAEQAADVLLKSQPKLGVYYHTRNEPQFADGLLATTREVFDGDVLVSGDLTQIRIGADGVSVSRPTDQ